MGVVAGAIPETAAVAHLPDSFKDTAATQQSESASPASPVQDHCQTLKEKEEQKRIDRPNTPPSTAVPQLWSLQVLNHVAAGSPQSKAFVAAGSEAMDVGVVSAVNRTAAVSTGDVSGRCAS